MSRLRHILPLLVATALVAVASIGTSLGASTTATTVVTAEVLSATNLDVNTGCAAGSADRTDFGQVLPGTSNVTGTNCSVEFGSSNDTSMLRAYQADRLGSAMVRGAEATLDTSFSGDGYLNVDLGGDEELEAEANGIGTDGAMLMQPDGKIVTGFMRDGVWGLARFLQDGTLDTAGFGNPNGYVTFPSMTGYVQDLALQPDGKILISGNDGGLWGTGRIHPDGSLDTNADADPSSHWNSTGLMSEAIGGASENPYTIGVLSTGRVIAAGVRSGWSQGHIRGYTSNGVLDTTFAAPNGFLDNPMSMASLNALIVDDQDRFIISADDACGCAGEVARFLEDGTLDVTFSPLGTPGIEDLTEALYHPAATNTAASDVVMDSQGRIVVTGSVSGHPSGEDVGVARLTTGGVLDTTFAGDGAMIFDVGTVDDYPGAVIVDVFDRPVIAGSSSPNNWRGEPFIARLTTAGVLDTSFGGTGIRSSIPPGNNDQGTVTTDLLQLTDGSYLTFADYDTGPGWDLMLTKYGGEEVNDYADDAGDLTGDDWGTPGAAFFGACLIGATNATENGTTWTVDAVTGNDCADGDADPWEAIDADGTGPSAKVLESDGSGQVTAQAHIRFGFRTASNQAAGSYAAPVTFEAVAPNV